MTLCRLLIISLPSVLRPVVAEGGGRWLWRQEVVGGGGCGICGGGWQRQRVAEAEGGGGRGWRRQRVVEAEGGAVSSLYPHCIPPKRGVCGVLCPHCIPPKRG